jgi:transcriptional regulator with XRE-family HTH domain
MAIHHQFAENLRRECGRFGSLAEICRGTGINRQQFNSYLASRHLPGAANLRRICEFLGISEVQLFESNSNGQGTNGSQEKRLQEKRIVDDELQHVAALVHRMTNHTYHADDEIVPQGYYYCYYPLHKTSSYLLRTLIRVWKKGDLVHFTRLTLFPSQTGTARFLARGKHQGIIFANSKFIQFLGISTEEPHNISLLSFDRHLMGGMRHYTGVAIVRTGLEQFASRAALQYLGIKVDLRRSIQGLGPTHIDDATLEPIVKAGLLVRPNEVPNVLSAMSLDDILPQTAGAVRGRTASIAHTV